ncbi:MAG: methionyl-tRNA formyltransferase [bacterium]|nr:methionyl-tRNA formyltransferase [bacterium]
MKLSIVFFGTPDIGLKSLEHLYNSDKFEVLGVVTQPDKPSGRGKKLTPSPIKVFAEEHNIPVFQPKSIRKEPDIIRSLKELEPDFFVTFAFGQILSQEILDIPKYQTINLHVSLLPKYRGANPIQRAIMNGDTETGICTMITELGLDCGDICLKEPIKIDENMNCVELFEICSSQSPLLLEKTLLGIADGSIAPIHQCEDGICYADKLNKEECRIDWTKSAKDIHNLVRGVYKCPGAFFEYKGKIIKTMETAVINETADGNYGDFVKISKSGIDVKTGNGILRLIKVKPEGKGEMSAYDWSNGLSNH